MGMRSLLRKLRGGKEDSGFRRRAYRCLTCLDVGTVMRGHGGVKIRCPVCFGRERRG